MKLFLLATKEREKRVNRAVNRLVRVMKHRIKSNARKGILSSSMVIEEAEIYGLPEEFYGEVYKRSAEILNTYFEGEVKIEVKDPPLGYECLESTILKV